MIPFDRVEINTTELCNRKCIICPRAHDYPNQNLHMTADVVDEICKQTAEYTDYITISGRGEPLLCSNILEIIETIAIHKKRFRLQTNGDFLDKYIHDLDDILDLKTKRNTNKIIVNCYDGLDQEKERINKWGKYKALTITSEREDDNQKMSDRFKSGRYVNRGGASLGMPYTYQPHLQMPCYILWRKAYFNWNGDLQLCCHDWTYIKTFGNIMQSSFKDIWEGHEINKYRFGLTENNGRSLFDECRNCDAIQEIQEAKACYLDWLG
jgi:radical SAM protein with 4Fe4S-binding SPASM domain